MFGLNMIFNALNVWGGGGRFGGEGGGLLIERQHYVYIYIYGYIYISLSLSPSPSLSLYIYIYIRTCFMQYFFAKTQTDLSQLKS